MRWNIERIADILRATEEPYADVEQPPVCHRLYFRDARLKYVLNLMPDTLCVFLAADPDDPEQGCPMLEYGFTCTDIEIGPSAYGENETAIRFYEHRDTFGGLRLTFTPRQDKNWYIWANVGGDHAGDGTYRIR
ncbi:hypothetical protein NHH03_00155 [Stieleria sp. TO1_6]|uniref:hypothetical protein n=1 Tax=Stieleria tagensis TaxID=2956795 RepID=UPI00209B210F|nr:hypothetical protein [Stieleria tagensis]MCO8120131.1 hypothetical protein [Stieleria tagensis]